MKNILTVIVLAFLFLGNVNARTKPNSVTNTYTPTIQNWVYEQKTHWFTGGVCYIQRSQHLPSLITFVSTMPEHVKVSVIDMCIKEANKLPWVQIYQYPTLPQIDTLREHRTENVSCVIVGMLNTPMVYQVRLSDIRLTGKDIEISECFTGATNSKDKVPQINPNQFNSHKIGNI